MPSDRLRFVVHIGLPKCASTSIQHYFADTYWKNLRQGVLYPRSGRLKEAYRSHLPLFSKPEKSEETFAAILREARLFRAKTVFLSCEDVTARSKTPWFRKAAQNLFDAVGRENVQIFAVSRSPSGLINSSYSQFLKNGLWDVNKTQVFDNTPGTIQDFRDAFRATWDVDLADHRGIIRKVAETFDLHEITELPLSPTNGDLLSLIGQELGLSKIGRLRHRNSSQTHCKKLFFREFQKKFGTELFHTNKRALTRLEMPECHIEEDEAVRLGLMLSRDEAAELDAGYVAEVAHHRFLD